MSISHSFVRSLSAAAAACSLLIAALPGQAAVIASFDPAFGPSIPNLGFRGSITLDVTAGCYGGSGFLFTGGSCQITPLSAVINYYNATSNSSVITTVSLPGTFFAPNYVFGAYFDPLTGQLAGLDTNDGNQFFVSVADSDPLAPIAYNGNMLLYFGSGLAQQGGRGAVGAFLVNCNSANQAERLCQSGNATTTSNPGRLVFTNVPEPDSVALALLGLCALAITRRRKTTVR